VIACSNYIPESSTSEGSFYVQKYYFRRERSMSRYENVEINLSQHAYAQYCDRVEQQLKQRQYSYDRRNFIHLAGVWWVYELEASKMFFVTCYGRTSMNVPKALGWAARNNDMIILGEEYAIQS
jgi:hypothetical protein